MKKYLLFTKLFILLALFFLHACRTIREVATESTSEEYTEVIVTQSTSEQYTEGIAIESTAEEYTEVIATESTAEEYTEVVTTDFTTTEKKSFEDYKVILSVDSIINKNETGILQVWIGAPHIKVSVSDGMTQDESIIPATIGDYAKITPIAPDFEVKNTSEEKCYKIHPSGSNVRFLLKPKMTGSYKVSANIEIYEGSECTGTSIPKTSEILTVTVDVNTKKEISKRTHELWGIVWEKFVTFWGGLITLFFTVLLFLIRRKMKKKTKFDETGM
jgi:hypothetical protein